jgi:hypothetical protein
MTREEALSKVKGYITDYLPSDNYEEVEEIIKALEQEPILDKIRIEIMHTGAYEYEVNGKTEFLKGIDYCLDVIDKYMARSEVEE